MVATSYVPYAIYLEFLGKAQNHHHQVTRSRPAIPRWLLNYALAHDWTLVSPDYKVMAL